MIKSLLDRTERLVLTGMGLVAIALSTLSLVSKPFDIISPVHEHIPEVLLILLSSFILSSTYRERIAGEFVKLKALGIQSVYKSRSDQGQFDAFYQILESTKSELFLVGITLKSIMRDHLQLLIKKDNANCSIDLLISHPRHWAEGIAQRDKEMLRVDFYRAISGLRALVSQIAQTGSTGKIEVRLHHEPVTLCLTVADGHSLAGKMRVELLPYNCARYSQFQPIIDLRRVDDGDWFGELYRHCRGLWDNAQVYIRAHGSGVEVDAELDREISELLGLERDWLPHQVNAPASVGT